MFLREPPGYDPGQDNIVRVQASRLRLRLETYFNEEGAAEELRIVIPKGGYVPRFEPAHLEEVSDHPGKTDSPESSRNAGPDNSEAASHHLESTSPVAVSGRRWWLYVLILCILCPLLLGVAYLRYEGPGASIPLFGLQLVAVPNATDRPLWKELFQRGQTTFIVPCDSGLVMYEAQSRQSVNLAQYLSGEVQTVPVINPSSTIDKRHQ